jgi:transposase
LAHPLKTRAIADAKVKNDRLDAEILTRLLRADLIPQSYIPSEQIRCLRELTRQHVRLTQIRTRIKNQGHALLVKLNLQPTEKMSDIFGKKGRTWLKTVEMSAVFSFQRDQILEQIEQYNHLIQSVDWKIEVMLREFSKADKLKEIPGIGVLGAAMLIGEIGEIERFPSPKQLVGYAGMAPGLYASGQTFHQRGITHQGNKFLRWILCEIAQHHILKPGTLRSFYLRLKQKKGHGKAVVATARKLLTQIYYVLKDEKAPVTILAG